jgi:hypothetical protein
MRPPRAAMPGKRGPAPDRFFRLVAHEPGDCWHWLGARSPEGYPLFFDGTRLVGAHRYAWRLLCGGDLAGLDLHHTCGNRGCVSVSHLWPLTRREHVRRHRRKGACRT